MRLKGGDSEPPVGAQLVFPEKKQQIFRINDEFDIASLNPYTPKLAKVLQKLTNSMASRSSKKEVMPKFFCRLKKAVLCVFFFLNPFYGQRVAYTMSYKF